MKCTDSKELIDENDGAIFWEGIVFCSQCGVDIK